MHPELRESSDERSSDEQSTDERASDEQGSNEQSSGEQSTDERASDEQGSSEQWGEEERYIVVKGRRWRRQDPSLPPDIAAVLRSQLGRGRSAVGAAKRAGDDPTPLRRRVNLAKHGLGERGTPWWEQSSAERQQRWERALRELAALDDRDPAV